MVRRPVRRLGDPGPTAYELLPAGVCCSCRRHPAAAASPAITVHSRLPGAGAGGIPATGLVPQLVPRRVRGAELVGAVAGWACDGAGIQREICQRQNNEAWVRSSDMAYRMHPRTRSRATGRGGPCVPASQKNGDGSCILVVRTAGRQLRPACRRPALESLPRHTLDCAMGCAKGCKKALGPEYQRLGFVCTTSVES